MLNLTHLKKENGKQKKDFDNTVSNFNKLQSTYDELKARNEGVEKTLEQYANQVVRLNSQIAALKNKLNQLEKSVPIQSPTVADNVKGKENNGFAPSTESEIVDRILFQIQAPQPISASTFQRTQRDLELQRGIVEEQSKELKVKDTQIDQLKQAKEKAEKSIEQLLINNESLKAKCVEFEAALFLSQVGGQKDTVNEKGDLARSKRKLDDFQASRSRHRSKRDRTDPKLPAETNKRVRR